MPKLDWEGRALVLAPPEIKQVFAELDFSHREIAQLRQLPQSVAETILETLRVVCIA